jgi:DNA-directed RNA polymerase subunit RPC12/RpoP
MKTTLRLRKEDLAEQVVQELAFEVYRQDEFREEWKAALSGAILSLVAFGFAMGWVFFMRWLDGQHPGRFHGVAYLPGVVFFLCACLVGIEALPRLVGWLPGFLTRNIISPPCPLCGHSFKLKSGMYRYQCRSCGGKYTELVIMARARANALTKGLECPQCKTRLRGRLAYFNCPNCNTRVYLQEGMLP